MLTASVLQNLQIYVYSYAKIDEQAKEQFGDEDRMTSLRKELSDIEEKNKRYQIQKKLLIAEIQFLTCPEKICISPAKQEVDIIKDRLEIVKDEHVHLIEQGDNLLKQEIEGPFRITTEGIRERRDLRRQRKEKAKGIRLAKQEASRLNHENILKQRDIEWISQQWAELTIEVGADERCHWVSKPLENFEGKVCGAYYNVLELNHKQRITPEQIKKAYDNKIFLLHSDTNPSHKTKAASKIVLDAYKCLSDFDCRTEYNIKLEHEKNQITRYRESLFQPFYWVSDLLTSISNGRSKLNKIWQSDRFTIFLYIQFFFPYMKMLTPMFFVYRFICKLFPPQY